MHILNGTISSIGCTCHTMSCRKYWILLTPVEAPQAKPRRDFDTGLQLIGLRHFSLIRYTDSRYGFQRTYKFGLTSVGVTLQSKE